MNDGVRWHGSRSGYLAVDRLIQRSEDAIRNGQKQVRKFRCLRQRLLETGQRGRAIRGLDRGAPFTWDRRPLGAKLDRMPAGPHGLATPSTSLQKNQKSKSPGTVSERARVDNRPRPSEPAARTAKPRSHADQLS